MTLAALGITTLSMPASSLLPVKACLAALDLGAFRAMLAQTRQGAGPAASLRDPIVSWGREHGLPV
jgi:phosphotransferase system enzyme I (PtsP)